MNNYKTNTIVLISLLVLVGVIYWYVALYSKTVARNVITIKNCSNINPRMMSVTKGGEITFVNNDKTDHRFSIGNNSINVAAGKILAAAADFQYGAGTYFLDCDLVPNALQINILSEYIAGPTQGTVSLPFQKIYDDAPVSLRDCLKTALGKEFEKTYNDANYSVSEAARGKMVKCSAKPTEEDVTFKEYYDAQGKKLQDCLKNGLGDEFTSLINDTKRDLSAEHRKNMTACLNRI